MATIQFCKITGSYSVIVPKILCKAKGIKKGTKVDFVIDERADIKMVIAK